MRLGALALCGLMLATAGPAVAAAPYVVGDHVADFTLNDAYGTPVSLYDFEGKVVWLDFWTPT